MDDSTAALAHGHDVVCAFVNDAVGPSVIDKLYEQGVCLIALRSAGCNNVAIDAIVARKLSLVHVPAYSPHAVAEHALALLLTLNRKTHKVYNRVREGNFSLEGVAPGFDLAGKTVGVLGTGKIGECFVRIMMGLGCRVLGHDVKENPVLKTVAQQMQMVGGGKFVYKPFDEVLEVRYGHGIARPPRPVLLPQNSLTHAFAVVPIQLNHHNLFRPRTFYPFTCRSPHRRAI